MNAAALLDKIESLLPELRRLAHDGELEGDYWPDLDRASELLKGVVEAFEDK